METYRIYHINGNLLHEGEAKSFVKFVESKKDNLQNAYLSEVDLSHIDLSEADLYKAYLYGSNLSNTSLVNSRLVSANLSHANLSHADLLYSHLVGADLSHANLSGANFDSSRLIYSTLYEANFRGANLVATNLIRTNFQNTKLTNAFIPIFSKRNLTFCSKNQKATIENISLSDIQIKIGCKEKSIPEWDAWFSGSEEYEIKRGTFEFRQIEAHYKAYRAYLVHLYGGNE
jgi:hypothetical protein